MTLLDRKFNIRLVDAKLNKKPAKDDWKTWSTISNKLSESNQIEMTLPDIMEKVTSGAIFQLGRLDKRPYTVEEQNELVELWQTDYSEYERTKAKLDKRAFKLVSSDIIAIDIDNNAGNVDPQDVIQFIRPTTYYYSFSHGMRDEHSKLKQNAYRLLFALSEPCDAGMIKFIEEQIKSQITQKFADITLYHGEVEGTSEKKFVLGTKHHEYEIYNSVLDVSEYKDGYQFSKDLDELKKVSQLTKNANPFKENEYLEMAHYLANKGVEVDFNTWQTLAIGVWHSAQQGQYSEETALQILRIYDREQQTDAFYKGYKRNPDAQNPSTVATFVKLAKDNGFKRNKIDALYQPKTIEPDIPTEIVEIDKYIPSELMLGLLENTDKNIIIESPTSSGKTTSIITALKEYLKAHTSVFAYIATPSKALAGQVAKQHGLGNALSEGVNVPTEMSKTFASTGIHLHAGTYDKAHYFMKQAKGHPVIVIADEAHKEVLDYSYRRKAIKGLYDLKSNDQVFKFIGLSGTPQEIDLSSYDSRIVIKLKNEKPIFNELKVVEYHEADQLIETLADIIAHEVSQGQKVLAFVNNKKKIASLQHILKTQKIKVKTITSDTANLSKSIHYRKLLHEEKYPDNCDALIATNVIADGINIMNENDNYTCIIAPHYRDSPLFNISTIKQATNRFRNQYQRVLIPIFVRKLAEGASRDEVEAEQLRAEQRGLYGLENEYMALLGQADKIAELTRSRFKDNIMLYQPSMLERANGLLFANDWKTGKRGFDFERALIIENRAKLGDKDYDQSTLDVLNDIRDRLFNVDNRLVRKRASDNQERYYKYFYNAFIKAVEDILRTTETRMQLFDYLSNTTIDEDAIHSEIEAMELLEAKSEKEKRDKVGSILTEKTFLLLQQEYVLNDNSIREDSDLWRATSGALASIHSKALKDLIPFCDYHEAVAVLTNITRNAEQRAFYKGLEAIYILENLDSKTHTFTKNILDIMLKSFKKYKPENAKQRDMLLGGIAKELNIKTTQTKELKSLYNQFFRHDNGFKKVKGKKVRTQTNQHLIKLQELSPYLLTSDKQGVEYSEIKDVYKRFKYNYELTH